MSYRAIGIQIEGIGTLSFDGATIWTFGRNVTVGSVTYEWLS